MKRLYILLVGLLVTFYSDAQIKVINDTAFRPFSTWPYYYIDSLYHLETDYAFELRFYARSRSCSYTFILSQKEKQWHARFFIGNITGPVFITENIVRQDSLPQLWRTLMKNHVLTLPDTRTFKDSTGEMLASGVYDGYSYHFELSTPTAQRFYWYLNAGHCADEFPHIKEFRQVAAIIQAIYNLCGIKQKVS